jgi:hypothetical protein
MSMDELDRDKLSEVGQVTTPTHGAIGLDSNGPWEPGEWFNLAGLGHASDTQAVEAHFKPKIELPGIPFSQRPTLRPWLKLWIGGAMGRWSIFCSPTRT